MLCQLSLSQVVLCMHLFLGFVCFRLQKKKKLVARVLPQPIVSDATYQMPAVRQSDVPITPMVFGLFSLFVEIVKGG